MARLVTKNAKLPGAKRKSLCFGDRQANPPRGQDAAELPVRKQSYVAIKRAKMGNKPVGPGGNQCRHFATRTTVPKDIPARSSLSNIGGKQSLVISVVPFSQVGLDRSRRRESGQLTGSPRPLARAGQHSSKPIVAEPWSKFARLLLAAGGQRNVGAAGVLASQRPLGLAMPHDI